MKQQLKHFMLTVLVALCSITAFAEDFEVDGIYYNYNDDGTSVEVTYRGYYYWDDVDRYTGAVTIPSSITIGGKTYSVTSTGENAFYGCRGLTSVTIPNSVTSIGRSAFYNCSGLTSVTIPNSGESIGENAFYGCRGLTSVTIPNSVMSIGNEAFRDCSSLTLVTIGNNVTSIGDHTFFDCSGLTEITVADDNMYYCDIDGVLFNKDQTELIQFPIGKIQSTYTIPNSVTSIGEWAFCFCRDLTSVTIPNSVMSIGNYAFCNCSSLTLVTIHSSVTSIGDNAFGNCSSLTSISVEEDNANYCDIDGVLFSKDKTTLIAVPCGIGITQYKISNSVTSIGWSAFCNCSSLTSITIGNSVTNIGYSAFYQCSGLMEIVSLNTTPPSTITTNTFNGISKSDCVVKVPIEAVEAYKAAYGWKDFENIVALEETEITVTISPAEYATLTLPFDAEVPEGLAAYTCDVVNGSALVLNKADEIKACTPYIIKGAYAGNAAADGECLARPLGVMTNKYTFKGYPVATTGQFEVGQLVGTLEDIYAPQGSYVLQSQDGVVGFYRVAADNSITVKANRAYLKAQASGIRAFTFAFAADDETAINPVVVAEKEAETYSLSGVRVGKDYKGIVIRDGKKFLNR